VDEERLVRASLCPAAGFGLVDASARLPLAGCDEGRRLDLAAAPGAPANPNPRSGHRSAMRHIYGGWTVSTCNRCVNVQR